MAVVQPPKGNKRDIETREREKKRDPQAIKETQRFIS